MPLSKFQNDSLSSMVWQNAPAPDKLDMHSVSQELLIPRTVLGPELPEAEFETTAELERFRREYRSFRMGHYRGAQGEAPRVADIGEEWDDLDAGGDQMDMEYAAVHEYRIAYRRHRQGGAHGAKGEIIDIGRHLSARHCLLLPVAQLLGLRKHLKAWGEMQQLPGQHGSAAGLHVHVGAGRLGMGLVLPAIVASGRSFAIVQRCSAAWAHASSAARVQVNLNGEPLVSLRVVKTVQDVKAALAETERAMLVLSEELAVLRPFVTCASSYSCAIGGKDLTGALEPLIAAIRAVAAEGDRDKSTLPPLYACENDHEAVVKLGQSAGGQHLEMVPVLVDRVCTERRISESGTLDIVTEPYAGDLVIPPLCCQLRGALPFGGPTVKQPSTAEGMEFLHRKKILTVNGTHTTLAFLTLVKAEPKTKGPPHASHELLAFDVKAAVGGGAAAMRTPGRICWVWAVARQLMLLDEFPDEVLRHTLGNGVSLGDADVCEVLVTGAEAAMSRLSHGGDQTSRVLGGGVVSRWKGRLANVSEWLGVQSCLTPLAGALLRRANVGMLELRQSVDELVSASKRFTEPARCRDISRSLSHSRSAEKRWHGPRQGVLFDFDGTLGNTELPAMEVAFWMLAPYIPRLEGKSDEELRVECAVFVRENAGKAFEQMIEACDKAREAAGLQSTEAARRARQEPAALAAAVDRQRVALGLRPVEELRRKGTEAATLLQQQKDDTVARLAVAAEACPGVVEALEALGAMDLNFVIATTSGKPRVPVCVDAAGLRRFFPSDELHIHSGESDFDPPCFKPAPDVYLRAARHVRLPPSVCVAVEDSASGVGSASNAGIGLIVGYVGAGHIAPEQKEAHARMLMKGARADNGRGADLVLEDMRDLPCAVRHFAALLAAGHVVTGCTRLPIPHGELQGLVGRAFFWEE